MFNIIMDMEELFHKKGIMKENSNGKKFLDKNNPEVKAISEKLYEKLVESPEHDVHKSITEKMGFSVELTHDDFGPVSGVVVRDNTYIQIG